MLENRRFLFERVAVFTEIIETVGQKEIRLSFTDYQVALK